MFISPSLVEYETISYFAVDNILPSTPPATSQDHTTYKRLIS